MKKLQLKKHPLDVASGVDDVAACRHGLVSIDTHRGPNGAQRVRSLVRGVSFVLML